VLRDAHVLRDDTRSSLNLMMLDEVITEQDKLNQQQGTAAAAAAASHGPLNDNHIYAASAYGPDPTKTPSSSQQRSLGKVHHGQALPQQQLLTELTGNAAAAAAASQLPKLQLLNRVARLVQLSSGEGTSAHGHVQQQQDLQLIRFLLSTARRRSAK
jgi:hypothetical protein